LSGDTLRFWGEAAQRRRLLRAIIVAPDLPARDRALRTVDDAIAQGLAALGFRRAPIRSLVLATSGRPGMAGLKYVTCDLRLSESMIRREVSPGGAPDGVVETWIHESVHGRRFPWGPNARTESSFPGFEEGLAEGVTRLVSQMASFVPGLPVYGRYVQTYEELAFILGVSSETLYRRMYRLANGAVMDGFASEIDALRGLTGSPPLTVEQRGRLNRAARRLFDSVYQQDPASARVRSSIRQTWRRALR
jgi:hypothetical protein